MDFKGTKSSGFSGALSSASFNNVPNKLALYVPTYRENQMDNRQIDKVYFEKQLPNYTLINQLHPSIPNSEHIAPTSELIMMADIIISDIALYQ